MKHQEFRDLQPPPAGCFAAQVLGIPIRLCELHQRGPRARRRTTKRHPSHTGSFFRSRIHEEDEWLIKYLGLVKRLLSCPFCRSPETCRLHDQLQRVSLKCICKRQGFPSRVGFQRKPANSRPQSSTDLLTGNMKRTEGPFDGHCLDGRRVQDNMRFVDL